MLTLPLFIAVEDSCSENSSVLLGQLENGDYCFINPVWIVFFFILIVCIIRLYLWARELVRLVRRKFNIPSLINEVLPETAWLVFVSGMAI